MTRRTLRISVVGAAALSLSAAHVLEGTQAGDPAPVDAPAVETRFFRGFVGSWDTEVSDCAMRVICEAAGADRVFHRYAGDALLQPETHRSAAK